MNKLLLSTALACLLSSGAMAQNQQVIGTPKQAISHKGLFGKRHAAKTNKNVTNQNKTTTTKTKDFKLQYAPKAPQITDFKPLNYVPYDTILCTQQNHIVNGQTTMSKNFEYDQYGLYRMVTVNDEKGKEENRYTYQVGDFNFWTSRLIETRTNGGEWEPKGKTERAFNANKQVTSEKEYQVGSENKLILYKLWEYDWNHKIVERDEYNDTIISTYYGANTHYVDYDWYGNIEQEFRHEWYEPLQQYVETYHNNLYEKRITELKENETVTKIYSKDYDNINQQEKEFLSAVIIKFYGNVTGTYEERYDSEGNQIETHGRKTETLKNTPSEGITTILTYEYIANDDIVEPGKRTINEKNWYPVYKECKKGYDKNGKIVIGKDYEDSSYRYNDTTNKWELNTLKNGHWMNDRLLRVKYQYSHYNETDYEIRYYLYTGDDNYRQNDIEYDPINKCYMFEEYDEESDCWIANYYNLQNEIIQRIRIENCTLGLYIDHEKYTSAMYHDFFEGMNIQEWKNERWTPLTGTFEAYSDSERTKISADTKGNVISIEYYDYTEQDLVGKLDGKDIYEYKENEIKHYYYEYKNGVQVGTDTTYLKNLGNGEYEYYIEYSTGELNKKDREHCFIYPDGLIKEYKYRNDKWEDPYYFCPLIVTVDEKTGIKTTIERGYDEVTKQYFNIGKREELDHPETNDHRHNVEYIWNKERNGWEGTHYEIIEPRNLSVPFKAIKYPPAYDDYSKYPTAPKGDDVIGNAREINIQIAKWSWKDNTSSEGVWLITECDIAKIRPNGANSYSARIMNKNGYKYEFRCDYFLELDEQQQVKKVEAIGYEFLGYKENPETHVYERVVKDIRSDYEFTYNAQGFVTEKKELPYKFEGNQWVLTGDEIIDQYVFTDVKLTPTAVEEMQQTEGFQISGREISAADNALINVYDLSGRKVASGKGKLTLSATGLYLIKCNGKTAKVSCR